MISETFREIQYSDRDLFEETSDRLQLKKFSDDLLISIPFDNNFNAQFATSPLAPVSISGTPILGNFNPFGANKHAELNGTIIYDKQNFTTLENEGSIKFWLRSNFNNGFGEQTFKNTTFTPPGSSTVYSVKINDGGNDLGDFSITLNSTSVMVDVYNLLSGVLLLSSVDAFMTGSILGIRSTTQGNTISLSNPSSGNSLITLLGGVNSGIIPNGPTSPITFFSLTEAGVNNRITLTHLSNSHIQLQIYNANTTLAVDQDLGLWSNDPLTWSSFELNFNQNIGQFFINGFLTKVFITEINRIVPQTQLVLFGGPSEYHYISEVIIYNKYKHIGNYTPEIIPLTPYTMSQPYADIIYGEGFLENQTSGLSITASSNTSYVIKIGLEWWYWFSGQWTSSDGTISQSTDYLNTVANFSQLIFDEDSVLIIRVFFNSNGQTESYIDNIDIITSNQGSNAALITGKIDLTTPIDLSVNNKILITTDKGKQIIDLTTFAITPSATTLFEIKKAINSAGIPGFGIASDDGSGHLVLQSADFGSTAFIEVDLSPMNDAYALVWDTGSSDTIDYGEDPVYTGQYIDYSEIFRWIRSRLGGGIVPVELTDEQLEDCLSETIWHFNRWRNFLEDLLYTTLIGNNRDGYEIPAIVGGPENIVDIVMTPRYPFSYYAGRDDLMSNIFIQQMFAGSGMGLTNTVSASNIMGNVADYYITLSAINDIGNILGTIPRWEILNGKIIIKPNPTNALNVAIKFRSALTVDEVVISMQIKRLALAFAKITLGTIRSTFGNSIPGGDGMIQLNGAELLADGQAERDAIIAELKSGTQVYEWFFG